MTTINSNVGLSNIELEDLVGKSTEEITQILQEAMEGMSAEERTAFLDSLPEELGDIEESVFAKIDDLEEDMHEVDDDYLEQRYEEDIEELEELADLVEDFDSIASAVDSELTSAENFYTREVTASTTVDYSGQVQEGDEIVLNVAENSSSGLFDESDTSGSQYSTTVSINLNYDQLSLVGYDMSTETATFSITTEEGVNFHIVINGGCNIAFNGHDYINTNALDSWPDSLLKRCLDGSKSFYNYVYGTDSEEVVGTTEVGSEVLNNFEEDITALNTLLAQSSTYAISTSMRSEISAEEKTLIDEMLRLLLGSDLYITDSDTSIAEAWEKILEKMSEREMDSKNKIFGALAFFIGKYDSANYDSVFTTNILTSFHEAINYYSWAGYEENGESKNYSLDVFSRVIILINENYSANKMYGGTTSFLALDSNGDINIKALEFIQTQFTNFSVQEAITQEQADSDLNPFITLLSTDDVNSIMDGTNSTKDFNYYAYYNVPGKYRDDRSKYYKSENITYNELKSEVGGLFDLLANPPSTYASENGQMTADVMRAMIEDYATSLPGFPDYHVDDVLCVFFTMLHNLQPDIFNSLCADSEWASRMWGYMNEGGWQPGLLENVQGFFQALGIQTSAIQ